jgi:hypothetical protein
VPRFSNPKISTNDYIREAVDAFCLLCNGRRGPRDALLFEVFRRMTMIAVDAADLRVSDFDRLHALFNAAVDAAAQVPPDSPG